VKVRSLIYTCQLNEANPFDYLTQLQRPAGLPDLGLSFPCFAPPPVACRPPKWSRAWPHHRYSARLISLGQGRTNQLLVVAREHALVGERRVAPDELAPESLVGRRQQFAAADLLITLGAELGDDQVA
jgi:hypothetical protein